MVRTKRIRRYVILAIVIVIAIIAISVAVRSSKKITGTEWFIAQQKYVEQFADLADQTDDIMTLYITGDISEDDFLTHVSVLRSQLKIMETGYNDDLKNANIKNGSHTVVSKEGADSIPACFDAFYDLYDVMESTCGDVDTLTYAYLACRQTMVSALADYETSLSILYGEAYDEVAQQETEDLSSEEDAEQP